MAKGFELLILLLNPLLATGVKTWTKTIWISGDVYEEVEMTSPSRGDPSIPSTSISRADITNPIKCYRECKITTGCESVSFDKINDICIMYNSSLSASELVKQKKHKHINPVDYEVTEPPATEPPATEPPATEPPATEPPATEPPATEPPATEPPATEPPATGEPEATEPPSGTEPPACGVYNRQYVGIPGSPFRIVGGETAASFVPWQVGITDVGSNFVYCGGSLISDRHVLTAAHCVFDYYGNLQNRLKVEFGWTSGEENLEFSRLPTGCSTSNETELATVTIHADYDLDSPTNEHDIALLTLDSPVDTNCWTPVCLPSAESEDMPDGSQDHTCYVSGWGTLEYGGGTPDELQIVRVFPVGSSYCNNAYGGINPDTMICAADDGRDSCQGDSGGPLFCQENTASYSDPHYLQGIVSSGYKCAEPGYPGIYTKVYNYLPWIEEKTGLQFGVSEP